MLPYALTIFLSAFLLFQLQPLMGKYLLPWFGGTPAVWTTCMLFFQSLLLIGYVYAHLSIGRFTPRHQVRMHLTLLALALLFLPAIPSTAWRPLDGSQPVAHILAVLGVTIGIPYLLLSSTAPLLQAWFSRARPGQSPYRLFALSNAGSLLGLLSYPLLVEPGLGLFEQSYLWSGLFVVFVASCAWCALGLPRDAPSQPAGSAAPDMPDAAPPGPAVRLLWLMLAACGSVVLLATTNQISQDVAPVPLLWILPLSLYLLSFIACFESDRWYRRPVWAVLLALTLAGAYHALVVGVSMPLLLQIGLYAATLFACCMVCHGELALLRPAPAHLTSYYLSIAAGGALGGVLVTLVAPALFNSYWEYPGALLATCLLLIITPAYQHGTTWLRRPALLALPLTVLGTLLLLELTPALTGFNSRAEVVWSSALGGQHWQFLSLLLLGLGLLGLGFRQALVGRIALLIALLGVSGFSAALVQQTRYEQGNAIALARNFYGVLSVTEHYPDHPWFSSRAMHHGRIRHGDQYLHPLRRLEATAYYGPNSGIALGYQALHDEAERHARESLHSGVLGLGTGTLAIYGRSGDRFRFYEIDPDVIRFAHDYFYYLASTPAEVEIILGDARLSLEHERDAGLAHEFDMLVMDAFSGDAIPLHLVTREALDSYLHHLRPGGILALNVTNRYIDLVPLVDGLAESVGLTPLLFIDDGEGGFDYNEWMLLTNNPDLIKRLSPYTRRRPDQQPTLLFTDDYSNLLKLLRRD